MEISTQSIIGDLVAQDYRLASIFSQHGIDFCCNGNRSIEEACKNLQLDTDLIIQQLQTTTQLSTNPSEDYNSWSLDDLADHIIETHHHYVTRKIQEILPYLQKIVDVHGPQHPELIEVQQLFLQSAADLSQHMKKEELILFPFIRKMTHTQRQNLSLTAPMFGTVENPIAMMHEEHDHEGERFRQMAKLTDDYTPPADACNTYRTTFALLQEFEKDLHLHIHLENNILFPKAIELEKELNLL